MKKITIKIYKDSVISSLIDELDQKIPDSIRNSTDFKLSYLLITDCIKDFIVKAQKFSNKGTSIHIEREFKLCNLNLVIVLDSTKKSNFFESFISKFQRG